MDEEAFDGMDLFELLDVVDYWEPVRPERAARADFTDTLTSDLE